MNKKRPVIGITRPEDKMLNIPFYALKLSVWIGGGKPRTLTSQQQPVEEVNIDGLMLGGGTDIFPGLFEKDPKENYRYDKTRDELEMKWLKWAEAQNLPVFAICRGAQLMNVVKKGTLHMDVSAVYKDGHYPSNLLGTAFFRKKITIETGSLLHKIFGKEVLFVNSLHKQSIDKIGYDLKVTAREVNGVVQAIEKPGHPFFMGVQFHPELLIYKSIYRHFFRYFIDVVKGNKA